MDLALNNPQRLIYHKTQTINQPIKTIYLTSGGFSLTNNITFALIFFQLQFVFVKFFLIKIT